MHLNKIYFKIFNQYLVVCLFLSSWWKMPYHTFWKRDQCITTSVMLSCQKIYGAVSVGIFHYGMWLHKENRENNWITFHKMAYSFFSTDLRPCVGLLELPLPSMMFFPRRNKHASEIYIPHVYFICKYLLSSMCMWVFIGHCLLALCT